MASGRWQTGLAWPLLAAMVAGGSAGCADSFTAHRKELEALHAAGRYDAAAALLDSPATDGGEYGERNALLYWLDRGAVALAQDQPAVAVENLNKAEQFMEVRRKAVAGDQIGRWLINDTAAAYFGEPYEEQYVNVLKLLARLEMGDIEGGATVEARRLAGKADVLRGRYLESVAAVGAAASERGAPAPSATVGGYTNPEGQFVESTLGMFLSAVTFMKSGDRNLQEVTARRLLTDIEAQKGLIGPVQAEDFANLGEVRPERVNLLVVALSGRGPTKEAQRFGPIPLYTYTVYFELPELRGGSAEVARARAVIDGGALPSQELPLVEDMRAVAVENHKRQLPLIYARAFLRSSLKAAAVAIGTESARYGARGNNDAQLAIELAGILGGLLFVTQTEKADLRSWAFLPAQAHAGITNLPPGQHTVRVEYLSSGGGVLYATPDRTVTVGAGAKDLTTLVEHYWR